MIFVVEAAATAESSASTYCCFEKLAISY